MRASLFLCPLKRVVRVTSPASLSFAPASPTPLRVLRLSPAHRPGCTLCVVESFWRGLPRSRARPALLQGPAAVEPATVPHAGHWLPALPWAAPRPSGFSASGNAAFWTPPHRGPVCTGDAAGFSHRDCRRSARCLPPLSIGSAVAAGLCPASRRRPSIPPPFRRSPAPRGRPRAASGSGRPSAEPKPFGSGKDGSNRASLRASGDRRLHPQSCPRAIHGASAGRARRPRAAAFKFACAATPAVTASGAATAAAAAATARGAGPAGRRPSAPWSAGRRRRARTPRTRDTARP